MPSPSSVISRTLQRGVVTVLIVGLVAVPAAAQLRTTLQQPLPSTSPFNGSVPQGTVSPEPLTLTIVDAIHRALDHNLGVLQAEESVDRAKAARWLALTELLPHINTAVSQSRRTNNLEAFGFPLNRFPGAAGIGPVVGPFNVFDARLFASQTLLDMSAVNDTRAEAHNLAAANHDYRSARDLVVLVSANLYLESLAFAARAATARSQLETSQALYTQAQDLRQSGIVAGLDVVRAEVRLSTDRQRATLTANDAEIAKLQLARVIGLPPGQEFTLDSALPDVPVPDMTMQEALDRAYKERPDFLAAQERVRAAESTHAAVRAELLPTVKVNADYGAIGLAVSSALSTFNVTGLVSVPIFEGGRVQARLARAQVDVRNRQSEMENLRGEIYYDVRSAFLDLQATREQLQTATRGRELADQQLAQSRDRFAAGVANNIEVVQAQEAVALANEQYISALYGYNVSKALLARSLGTAESAVERLLGGSRP
jgi:outer membrane protein TolC